MNVTGNIISDLRAAASDARIAAMPSRAAVCDRAADEIEKLLGILGTIRRECGTPWIAPDDARTAIMRLVPDEAP